MRFYVIRMGKDFEDEKAAHGSNFFSTPEQASDWAKLNLELNQKFMICDENGGVVIISQAPPIEGNA